MALEIVIQCKECGAEIDQWDLYEEDPATHLCEIAGDLDFDHECPSKKDLLMSNHLHPDILANIAQSEKDGGVWLKDLKPGDTVLVQTRNSMYRISVTDDGKHTIEGHPEYCPVPTKASIHGSTWGGSMLKIGFIGVGMHLEFSTAHQKEHGVVTTSRIRRVTLVPGT